MNARLYPPLLFGFTLLIGVAVLLPRVWDLRALLTPELPGTVQTELRRMTEENGWLMSDIELQEVEKHSMRFLHRQHIRGKDPVSCYRVRFGSSILHPCDDV